MKKRHILSVLAGLLVVGFGIALYGTEMRVRSLQWQGLGLMLTPVILTIRRIWKNHLFALRMHEEREERKRMVEWCGAMPTHPPGP